MSRKGVTAVYDVNHIVPQSMADMEELKMNESTDGGWQLVNKQDTEKPIENQALLDSAKPIDGNNNSKPIEDVGGNQVKLTEDEGIVNMAKPIEDKDNLKSIQESGDEQSVIASGASGVNRNSNDPSASAAPHELVIEEVPINSSSSSSSKSVLAEKIPIDQASSSNSSQNSENIEEANALDKQPPLTSTPTALQNAQHMAEATTAHPTKNIDFENFLVVFLLRLVNILVHKKEKILCILDQERLSLSLSLSLSLTHTHTHTHTHTLPSNLSVCSFYN
jgi:hypothetical protein